MLDSLTSENHRDFAQRYSGTFGWFLGDNGKKTLVAVGETNSQQVQFADVKGAPYFANADAGVQFEFIPVDRGFFNAKDTTYLLERVPQRQWHRGIHTANTRSYVPAGGMWVQARLNIKMLSDIFVDGVSLQTRLKEFVSGECDTVALSKHFAVTNGVVYFYSRKIGNYKDKVITLDSDLVKQEVCDVLRRNNIVWEVK